MGHDLKKLTIGHLVLKGACTTSAASGLLVVRLPSGLHSDVFVCQFVYSSAWLEAVCIALQLLQSNLAFIEIGIPRKRAS